MLSRRPRLYQWVKPRSLGLHLLFAMVAAGCLAAAWWQIHRAAQGNGLSYLYSVEWPAFIVVAGIGWWQMVHDTPEDIAERQAFHDRMRRASAEVVARTLPRSARALTVASAEIPAAPTPRQLGGGQPAEAPVAVARTGPAEIDTVLLTVASEQPPAGPEDAMTEYNRWLATLAIRGRPKTWRNPRGE